MKNYFRKSIIYINFVINSIVFRIYFLKSKNIFLIYLLFFIKLLRTDKFPRSIQEKFIFSSDKGAFFFDGKKNKCIYPGSVFGIDIFNKRVFLSISSTRNNAIISFPIDQINRIISKDIKIHYSQISRNKFHQIKVINSKLIIANTNNNCLTEIDLEEKKPIKHYYPFSDSFGRYIKSDHNHINAVAPLKDGFLFLANQNIQLGSLLGVIKNDNVKIFSYINSGCHDLISSENEIIISDSFGGANKIKKYESSSGLVWNNKFIPIESDMVRGLYVGKNYVLSGTSIKGDRSDRFFGNSHIKFLNQKNFACDFELYLNCAQIYCILGLIGESIYEDNDLNMKEITSTIEAENILKNNFGNSIYEGKCTIEYSVFNYV